MLKKSGDRNPGTPYVFFRTLDSLLGIKLVWCPQILFHFPVGPSASRWMSSILIAAALILAIHGNDAGAAQTDIMLKADSGTLYLTNSGLTAQLPDKFRTLGQTRGPQGMSFR